MEVTSKDEPNACYDSREASSLNPSTPGSPLLAAFDEQAAVFARPWAILQDAISTRAFPASSVAITHRGKLLARRALGRFVYEGEPNPAVTPETPFDLASLTKPVATTTMAAILYERGLLDLDAPIIGTIPEFAAGSTGQSDPRRHEVTFRKLLAHASGLPAYEKLFLKADTRDDLLRAVSTMPLSADPGSRAEYSDIGFIILGIALERLSQKPLDIFCRREIFGPLAMTTTTFNPSEMIRAQIPPTADEREKFRKRIIQGEVQDENASVLRGVAGHAGLFSTAEDLARFAHTLLQGGHPIVRPETVALFTRRESSPSGTTRALGWDTPSSPSQSGKYFGPNSYGHLGYTGTSLWIDPDRELSITLLTNRTWPDCANQALKQVRPKFHDAIIEALG